MKKHLRLLAWFLTLTMLCELLPLGTFAQSDIGQNLAQAAVQSFDTQKSINFAGGTGTLDDPYQISTPEQLDAIRNNLSAHYILVNDIDLSSYTNWSPIGSSSRPFCGTFDGRHHTVYNLSITSVGNLNAIGLFACIKPAHVLPDGYANIQNLQLKNVNFSFSISSYKDYAVDIGSIAGQAKCLTDESGNILQQPIIRNCSNIDGSINIKKTGIPDSDFTLGGLIGDGRGGRNIQLFKLCLYHCHRFFLFGLPCAVSYRRNCRYSTKYLRLYKQWFYYYS